MGRRSGFAAVGAIGVMGMAILAVPAPAVAAEVCRVQFTDVQLEPYHSGGRTLHRLRIRGEHNYDPATNTGGSAKTRFDITDGDGFFVMAVFVGRRGDGGEGGDPSVRTVRVPRAELDAVRRAAEIGQAYYDRVREIVLTPPRPENLVAILDSADKKQRLLSEIQAVLNEARDSAGAGDAEILGSVTWLNQQMARFRGDGGRDLRSQYRDNLIEGAPPNLLCGADARSAIVGRLACPAAFPPAPGPGRGDAPCPEGLTFSALVIPAADP